MRRGRDRAHEAQQVRAPRLVPARQRDPTPVGVELEHAQRGADRRAIEAHVAPRAGQGDLAAQLAAALAGANAIFGWLVLPETVTERTRRPFRLARANPFGAFRGITALPGVGRFLSLFFLYEFAFIVYPAVWAYFTKEAFGWSPGMVGASLALFGIAVAVVQAGLIRIVLARLGETGTILYGLCFNLLAFLVLAFVRDGQTALWLTPLTALGAVVTPALQAQMSKAAPDDRQGELQGVVSSARSVAQIFAPLAMTQIFYVFTAGEGPGFPGAPFLLSAGLMVFCLAVFLTGPGRRRETT